MKKIILVAAISIFVQGCANYSKLSSHFIEGCSAEDITVTNNSPTGLYSRAWVASCKGKTYSCSSVQKGQYKVETKCDEVN